MIHGALHFYSKFCKAKIKHQAALFQCILTHHQQQTVDTTVGHSCTTTFSRKVV